MNSTHFFLVAFILLLGLSLLIPARFYREELYPVNPGEHPAYLDKSLPMEDRITNLLSLMTLEEKIGQMALVDKNSVITIEDVTRYGLGALLSGAGAKPEVNTAKGWRDMIDAYKEASERSRLHIPILYGVDATHGHANVPGATVFPHAIGLGAADDLFLTEKVAEITRDELRATHINWSYSPNLDLPRDIRWGRTYETFSDDSRITALHGAVYVRGTEGEGESIDVLSTPKHFIGVGGMMWGSSSNKNFKIDQGTTPPDEMLLRTEYLEPFKAAIDVGAQSVMIGLNSWGDTKLAADKGLVTDLLKGELGFKGFAVSDWYGVYELPGTNYDNAVTAINAGIDMIMLPFDYRPFIRNVERAVRRGEIKESRIDDAVRRILRAKFALGLFDSPRETPSLESIGSESHRQVARTAVAKSLVLLKNENVLPITKDIKKIKIAGSGADNIGRQLGAWTVEWQGIDGNWLPGATSILAGIRARAGKDVSIAYNEQGDFDSDLGMADLGIAIVSEAPYAEGWGDRAYPIIDTPDREAIRKLQAVSKKTLVIIVSGRPLFILNELPSWDGLVAAWLPGSEGEGIADALFGDVPFTGKLPLPWPARAEDLPMTMEGSGQNDAQPLFPRGFGLHTFLSIKPKESI